MKKSLLAALATLLLGTAALSGCYVAMQEHGRWNRHHDGYRDHDGDRFREYDRPHRDDGFRHGRG
jgi:hypothetical protein